MTTGLIAALAAALALAFVEGLQRFYPSRPTWKKLRRRRGRLATRLMRERIEVMAEEGMPRLLAEILACLVIVWIAAASLLDKRWTEVVADILPYVFVGVALFRLPRALRAVAERMKTYEREIGEDPDADWRDGGGAGPAVAAL